MVWSKEVVSKAVIQKKKLVCKLLFEKINKILVVLLKKTIFAVRKNNLWENKTLFVKMV